MLRGRHYCGAVIIDQDWLLTAAHCVYGHDAQQFTALLGSIFSVSSSATSSKKSSTSIFTSSSTTTTSTQSPNTEHPIQVTKISLVPSQLSSSSMSFSSSNSVWNFFPPSLSNNQSTEFLDLGEEVENDEYTENISNTNLYQTYANTNNNNTEHSSKVNSTDGNLLLLKIDHLIVHENFTRTEFFRNDIALIK